MRKKKLLLASLAAGAALAIAGTAYAAVAVTISAT